MTLFKLINILFYLGLLIGDASIKFCKAIIAYCLVLYQLHNAGDIVEIAFYLVVLCYCFN